ncbi:MAG: pantetheine-phosphate adenylyltransferase [Flavobacteriales bacterium]
MKRIAVFPGSFDPVSLGHIHIAQRAANLFDIVYLAIGVNTNKICMFELSRRLQWVKIATQGMENVEVITYSGLTTDFCLEVNARFIVRGIRNSIDLEYEKAIAETNLTLAPEIQTVFLLSDPSKSFIQSNILRELIRNNSDVSMFLPAGVNVYE